MATLGKGDVSDICTAQGFSGELLKHLTHIVKKTFSARGNTVGLRGDR